MMHPIRTLLPTFQRDEHWFQEIQFDNVSMVEFVLGGKDGSNEFDGAHVQVSVMMYVMWWGRR